MTRDYENNQFQKKFLFGIFSLLILYVPLHAQKIPDVFWNAKLAGSARYFNIETNVPVKSVFRDQEFLRKANLDGTETYSRYKSKVIKGDDVYISIDTLQGNDILLSAKWQLTYRTDKNDVVISSIEMTTPDSGGTILTTLDDAMSSGDAYQKYMIVIVKMLNFYFDTEKISADNETDND